VAVLPGLASSSSDTDWFIAYSRTLPPQWPMPTLSATTSGSRWRHIPDLLDYRRHQRWQASLCPVRRQRRWGG